MIKRDTSILNTGTPYLNTDYCILIIDIYILNTDISFLNTDINIICIPSYICASNRYPYLNLKHMSRSMTKTTK